MDDVKAEFWGDLQADYYTQTSALYLANQTLESVLSTDGKKAHKPILSNPSMGDYVPHVDIAFDQKKAEKQTLEVDNFPYAAEVIDITEKNQTMYDLLGHSSKAIRQGLINRTEQIFTSKIAGAAHVFNGGTYLALDTTNIYDVIEEADGTLGAFDIPTDTDQRVAVLGPRTVSLLRKARSQRETPLGDQVASNGVIGPWKGWTIVQNNNLPWTATLAMATQPTAGDDWTILGRKIEFVASLSGLTTSTESTTKGYVLRGADAAASRANFIALINGAAGAGTTYVNFDAVSAFMIRNKRRIRASEVSTDVVLTGFGDITVRENMTAAGNVVSQQRQDSVFMVRGAIDLVMQFMDLEVGSKEKGFADLPKGIIGVGAKMFQDGALGAFRVPQDVSGWNS
jgi:hypothetical protein